VVQGQALGLLVLLVPPQAEPAEPVEDRTERRLGVALDVGVVDAQDHGPAVPPAYSQLKMKVLALLCGETQWRRRKTDSMHQNASISGWIVELRRTLLTF